MPYNYETETGTYWGNIFVEGLQLGNLPIVDDIARSAPELAFPKPLRLNFPSTVTPIYPTTPPVLSSVGDFFSSAADLTRSAGIAANVGALAVVGVGAYVVAKSQKWI